ncbi:MAG: MBL fold metallo-hydrolase [Candidatus Neomarinimicrobiota bacterium]|nr:MBL fold metallo-hydrolase [Candidatus Neomarinimicrobiota bacterium]
MKFHVYSLITGPFQENSYIISDQVSNDCILIDPCDEAKKISILIDDNNLNPIAIINTHAHLDHIGAVDEIKNIYNVPFYLHYAEKPILESYPMSCRMFGIEAKPIPSVDHWIQKGGELRIGSFKFLIIETPGHTPGGCCFLIDKSLFVGDTLFHGSVGRTDLPGGDWNMLEESLLYLMNNISSDITIYSGHGVETNIGIEMEKNPFLVSLKSNLN